MKIPFGQPLELTHTASGKTVLTSIKEAHSIGDFLIGLLNPNSSYQSMYFKGTRTIHTIGMPFALDIVFIDRQGICVGIETRVASGRILRGPRDTFSIIETKSTTPSVLVEIHIGDQLWVDRAKSSILEPPKGSHGL